MVSHSPVYVLSGVSNAAAVAKTTLTPAPLPEGEGNATSWREVSSWRVIAECNRREWKWVHPAGGGLWLISPRGTHFEFRMRAGHQAEFRRRVG